MKEKPKILWLNYLSKNGLQVIRKVTVTKDDSEIEKSRIKKLESVLEKKFIKDDTEKHWLIDVYVDGEYVGKVYYFGKLKNDLVLSYVKERVWTKDIVSVLENFNAQIKESSGTKQMED